jgi:hypothetical protein
MVAQDLSKEAPGFALAISAKWEFRPHMDDKNSQIKLKLRILYKII